VSPKALPAQSGRAWQPLTFGGVARYAHDWIGRLFVTGVLVSIVATVAIIVTARRSVIPVIDQAVTQLPPGAEIRGGRFTAPKPMRLAENSFLSIRFDPLGETSARSTSDFEMIFGPNQLRARSIFGVAPFQYPLHWTINLNRAELEPWWGAWRITAYGYLSAGTILFLFASWITLAIPYAIIARIAALIFKRRVSLWGSWKLSVAALMPGAILFSVGIFLYGWSQIRLADLVGIWIAHFVVGWIFLAGAIFSLPRLDLSNPFEKEPAPEEAEEPPAKNPFRGGRGRRGK
jgi:hypothetical protein